MLKKFKMTVAFYFLFTIDTQASLQVAIPVQDFCPGNSLVFISRDRNGFEQVAGTVSLVDGKTIFSHDEISHNNQILPLISDAKSDLAIITDAQQDVIVQQTEEFIYLYFDVDRDSIVRVLVIKNSLLADNPYNVLEFSAVAVGSYDDLDDEEEDFFGSDAFGCDELSQLNLHDIQNTQSVELSTYDTIVLSMYALWAVQSAQAKHMYKKFSQWMQSGSHE
jgi:hypothetical protein